MPPKPKKNEPSKKTEQKKKDKVVEDKTFGLKNKKGTKQQKFIQHVTKQVQCGNKSGKELEKTQTEKLTKKDLKKKEQEELNALFRPVEQKVAKGVDPKSVLCAFYKQGLCTKGDKCKFSHDLTIGRKAEKKSIYDDEKGDGMEDWDEKKLEEVIDQKHGEKNRAMPKTTIICRYFLDAVENSKYGWFWKCPNGDSCHYRHALPAGFMLKKDKKKMDEQKDDGISLEELIESERASLSSKNLTKVTLESFNKWKERKRQEKIDSAKAKADKKKQDFKAGRTVGISGREMFEFNPELLLGDDDEAEAITYQHESDDEDDTMIVREINLDALAYEARENDNTGTVLPPSVRNGTRVENGLPDDKTKNEAAKLDMAAAWPPENSIGEGMSSADPIDDVDADIDENLFDGEDLDLIEEELETLELDS